MSLWQEQMKDALSNFLEVSELAGEPLAQADLQLDACDAPHKQPSSLPRGKMAVYAFWWNGQWLKIGKAGPKSGARYVSQHYTGNAMSTLAGSLAGDARMQNVPGFDPQRPGDWIKRSTCRVNILLPADRGIEILSLLEAFLHVRLKPLYEGAKHSGEE